jgi:hypothetical protein
MFPTRFEVVLGPGVERMMALSAPDGSESDICSYTKRAGTAKRHIHEDRMKDLTI